MNSNTQLDNIHWLGVALVFALVALIVLAIVVAMYLILLLAAAGALIGCVIVGCAAAIYEPARESWRALRRYIAKNVAGSSP